MKSIPPKSRLRYLAHNPTGELVKVITKEVKRKLELSKESK
jgi:hypothetical protein